MPHHLYTVEAVWTIESRGLVLEGFRAEQYPLFRVGGHVDLNRPDGTVLRAEIVGVEYPPSVKCVGQRPEDPRYGVLVSRELNKDDVPIGTEVWSVDEPETPAGPGRASMPATSSPRGMRRRLLRFVKALVELVRRRDRA